MVYNVTVIILQLPSDSIKLILRLLQLHLYESDFPKIDPGVYTTQCI